MIRLPNTDPIPAPEPATPTVAAPAPINFAAESISLVTADVWRARGSTGSNDEVNETLGNIFGCWTDCIRNGSWAFMEAAALKGRIDDLTAEVIMALTNGVVQAYIFRSTVKRFKLY